MGVHISAYYINGIEAFEDEYSSMEYKQFIKDKHPTWDSLRYSGDRDFVDNIEMTTRYEGDIETRYLFEETYHRPKNIDSAINWVKENVFEGNQKRLIHILEEMKEKENLYFKFSF